MNLEGKKVAILATDGFEQSELESPRDALLETGATPTVVSPKPDSIRGWSGGEWGDNVDVDVALEDANPADYAALVLPGGVLNPDALRTDDRAVDFVRHFVDTGKPIGAICHGPWTLIDADGVKGRGWYPAANPTICRHSMRSSSRRSLKADTPPDPATLKAGTLHMEVLRFNWRLRSLPAALTHCGHGGYGSTANGLPSTLT